MATARVTSEPDPTTVSRSAPFIRSEPVEGMDFFPIHTSSSQLYIDLMACMHQVELIDRQIIDRNVVFPRLAILTDTTSPSCRYRAPSQS